MTPRWITAAIVLLVLPACAPMVTHAPRVDPGLTGVLTLGVPRDLCDSSCTMDLIPQYGFGMRYGRAPSGNRPGYSLGATLSLGLISSEADIYLQAPLPSERWAAGAGVLAAQTHLMPYVQVGRSRADGSGWYTTQGLAVLHSREEKLGLMLDPPSHDVRPV